MHLRMKQSRFLRLVFLGFCLLLQTAACSIRCWLSPPSQPPALAGGYLFFFPVIAKDKILKQSRLLYSFSFAFPDCATF